MFVCQTDSSFKNSEEFVFNIFSTPGTIEHMHEVLHELKNTTWHAFCRHFLNTEEYKYIYIITGLCCLYFVLP